MKDLTAKQQRIYDYILDYTADNGYPPSVREIAAAVGLKSPSTVHFHLKGLDGNFHFFRNPLSDGIDAPC